MSANPEQETRVQAQTDQPAQPRQALIFILLSFIWGAGLYGLGRNIANVPAWAVFIGIVSFSAPVVLSSLYLVSVRKIQNLAGFATQGWLYRLFSGRIIATGLWTIWAMGSTFFLLVQFRAYTLAEWLGFFSIVPILYGLYYLFFQAATRELRPYRRVADALRLARRIAPFVALVAYLLILQLAGGLPSVDTLGEAIALRRGEIAVGGGSALVREIAHFMAYYDGARLYVASQIGQQGTVWAFLMLCVGGWVILFNSALMLSCFLVPAREYRRVFAQLSDADAAPAPEPLRMMITSAIIVFVVLFVALPGFADLEFRAQQHTDELAEAREPLETVVVMIDELPYRPEVLKELRLLKLKTVGQLDGLQPRIEDSLLRAFDQIEENVDPFLDWYYELTAEYLRTLNLLRGELSDYLGKRLEEYLKKGDPFAEFEALLDEAMQLHNSLQQRFATESSRLLERNRLTLPDDTRLKVIEEVSLGTLLHFPAPEQRIPLSVRTGTGGAASLVTAAVVTKVVTKLSAKGILKLAAQPLAKALLSRILTVGGGMAGGAAAGSFIPGFGTAVGAIIGGVVGIVAGVGIDYGLLKLEEALGREKFRGELLDSINEARRELLANPAGS